MQFPKWRFLIAATITAFCAPFQMSYYATVINTPEQLFLDFINSTNEQRTGAPMPDDTLNMLWGWIVCLNAVGGFVGSLIAPFMAEKLGRKVSLMVLSNIVAVGSCFLMVFCLAAKSYEMLAVGRFVNGLSEGVATTILPFYLSECSPPDYRGFIGALQNLFINSQTVLAFVVALPTIWGNSKYLPILLGFGIPFAVVQMLSSFFMPESPKYLYIKKNDAVAAEKSLRFWSARGHLTPIDVKEAFHEFDQDADALSQEVGFLRAIKDPYFRRVFFISSALMACQNLTAVGAIFSYSTQMFMRLGFTRDEADLFTIMVSVVNLISSIIATAIVERLPRRKLYFISNAVLVLALLAYTFLSVAYDSTGTSWTAYMAIACLIIFCVVYNLGAGLHIFIVPSEMAPQAIRSSVVSVASAVGWGVAVISVFAFPSIQAKLGSWCWLTYIVPLTIGLIYLYKVMPETAGKSVAELVQESKLGRDAKMVKEIAPPVLTQIDLLPIGHQVPGDRKSSGEVGHGFVISRDKF